MKGLDTNVVLRLLLRDDLEQAVAADAFAEAECSAETPCLINRIVLVEIAWVLQSGYGVARPQVAAIIEGILRTEVFAVENAPEVWAALRDYRHGRADFADCLIGRTNRARGCGITATFDRAAASLDGFVLVATAGQDPRS
ncbi:MAG: type II toxin-antitoxin system VapC family toxin [Rhodospirillales bacterium]|nr:type II toxin-antitoxin system VapC family toxin [Rhodospirillales bacterium]